MCILSVFLKIVIHFKIIPDRSIFMSLIFQPRTIMPLVYLSLLSRDTKIVFCYCLATKATKIVERGICPSCFFLKDKLTPKKKTISKTDLFSCLSLQPTTCLSFLFLDNKLNTHLLLDIFFL
jgi:hypothetical protein